MSKTKGEQAAHDGQELHHAELCNHELRYYAAVSVRAEKRPNGGRTYTYYLLTMDGPGARLHTTLLGSADDGCDHLGCNLSYAVEILQAVENEVSSARTVADQLALELDL